MSALPDPGVLWLVSGPRRCQTDPAAAKCPARDSVRGQCSSFPPSAVTATLPL